MKKLLAGGLIAGTVFALSLWGAGDAKAQSRIASNVEIGNVDVSGMTSLEARNAIASYASEMGQKQVTLKTEDASIKVSVADLGFTADSGDSVESAVKYGRKGNLIERYQSIRAIDAGKKKCLSLATTADEEKIRDFLKKNEAGTYTEARKRNGYERGQKAHRKDLKTVRVRFSLQKTNEAADLSEQQHPLQTSSARAMKLNWHT